MTQPETAVARRDPASPVQAAMELLRDRPDFDVEKLGALLELEARFRAERAAEAFAEALTGFQAECPIVFKGRKAGDEPAQPGKKDFGYNYAGFDDIMRAIRPLLSKYKIVVTFTTNADKIVEGEAAVRMGGRCRIRVGTHFEETETSLPIPAMKVNDTQKFGAAVSYLKRYLLCAALNIVTSDRDDDAATQLESCSEAEVLAMADIIADKGVNFPKFLNWAREESKCRFERLDDMPRFIFPQAMDFLKRYNRPREGGK